MKKAVLILFAALLVICGCSKDENDHNQSQSEKDSQETLIEAVSEDLDKFLNASCEVSYEEIQKYLEKFPEVTTSVEDGILYVTTEDGGTYIIDNDNVCFLRKSSQELDASEEEISNLIKEINDALYPEEESSVSAYANKQQSNNSLVCNIPLAAANPESANRFLKKKKILIWSPWNLNPAYADRIINACNDYNSDARNSWKISCTLLIGAENCTLESMAIFSNYDIVVPMCHGTPKGYIVLPIIKQRKSNGEMEDDLDAQKRYLKSGYGIDRTYNKKTQRYEYSAIPSEAMLKASLPQSLNRTILWTIMCYACKSVNSVFRKVCAEKDAAAFFGADSQTTGNFASSVLLRFIPKFYSSGYARTIIRDICGNSDICGYSEEYDVDVNLKSYVEGKYNLQINPDYEILHMFAMPLKVNNNSNSNPRALVFTPQGMNRRARGRRFPSFANTSDGEEVGLAFTNKKTDKVTLIPFNESTINNYTERHNATTSCYEVECKTDMLEDGTYKYKTYIRFDGETTYSKDEYQYTKGLCPDDNHPHAIDMGAAGIWACCNVGASKPEEYGSYFAWGETEPKSDYSEVSYKYWTDSNGNGSVEVSEFTNIGSDIGGNSTYDAATKNWGSSWRMPSRNQMGNLIGCTSKWTQINGVNGRLFTASNGNKVFLPAAGGRNGASSDGVGSDGYYWSSSLYTSFPYRAYGLYFDSDDVYGGYEGRSPGLCVRPVRR